MVRSPKSAPARRAAVRPGRGSLLTAGAALATVVGALVVLPVTNASAATVLYVATTGKDTNAGSSAAPLKTVQAAVDKLPAIGGTILLKSGTYTGRVVLKDRAGIAIKEDVGATAVISGVGLDAPAGRSALIEIRNSSGIAVQGLDITGYRSASQDDQPMGILVIGGSTNVTIKGNRVHHLGNDNQTVYSEATWNNGNPTVDPFATNAHGIAVYGTSKTTPISGLVISDNEVDHLVLGASESVVVNGNVDGWQIVNNYVHDNNNIGIDAIGYEEQTFGKNDPLRFTDTNRARNGVIANNKVTDIVSLGNPAYYDWDDTAKKLVPCNCADGIYVDGGTAIAIQNNTVTRSDIGIEVASEHKKGKTNNISVTGNNVTASKYVGLAVGGYDATATGEAYDVSATGNTFKGNNTLNDGSPEILLQFKVHEFSFSGNTVTATNAAFPLLVQRVKASGTTAQNANVVLNGNNYGAPVTSAKAKFKWLGKGITGFDSWKATTGQDAGSTYSQR